MKSVLCLSQTSHCAYLKQSSQVNRSSTNYILKLCSVICPRKCTMCVQLNIAVTVTQMNVTASQLFLTATSLVHSLARRNRSWPVDKRESERLSQLISFYIKLIRHVLSHAMTHQSITLGRVLLRLVVALDT